MPRRLSFSCRQFRRQHAEFVDGFLSEEAQRAGEEHLAECVVCAQHDVLVRRSLLALQVLPRIEPSPDFRARLAERLKHESIEKPSRAQGVRWGMAGVIAAASVALLAASSARVRPDASLHAVPIVAQALVQPVALRPTAPAPDSVATVRTASVTATAPRTIAARFEALPGAYVERQSRARQGSAVRLQTVSYQGQ
jgi:hypothetical protein